MDSGTDTAGDDLTRDRGPSAFLREHWGLVGLLGAYGMIAAIVPTMADVSLLEDWVYSWSVERLSDGGALEVLALAGPNVVFEALWGSLFSLGRPISFGVLRISTLALTAIGATAFSGLLSELGVKKEWRRIGTAAYLFNPLSMALSYSFMTDAHALALSVISMMFLARGLARSQAGYLVLGSVFAGIAFLSRPQAIAPVAGALLVVALRPDRRSIRNVTSLIAIPGLVAALVFLWQRGGTRTQAEFFSRAVDVSPTSLLVLGSLSALVGLGYIGLFGLPVAVSVKGLRRAVLQTLPLGVGLSVVAFSLATGSPFPISGDWFTRNGLGPSMIANYGDLPDAVFGLWVWPLTVGVGVSAAVLFSFAVARGKRFRSDPVASMLGAGAVVSMLMLFPAAFLFEFAPPDRYYLPLLPVGLALLLWALEGEALRSRVAWGLVLTFVAFSAAGVHDALETERAVWTVASRAIDTGVPLDRLSAGASWDGYHFGPATSASGDIDYGFMGAQRPWWLVLMAPQIEPDYLVTLSPPNGVHVLDQEQFPTWLSVGSGSASLVPVAREEE